MFFKYVQTGIFFFTKLSPDLQTITTKYIQKSEYYNRAWGNSIAFNKDGDILWADYHMEFGVGTARSFVYKSTPDLEGKDTCYDLADTATITLLAADISLTASANLLTTRPLF